MLEINWMSQKKEEQEVRGGGGRFERSDEI